MEVTIQLTISCIWLHVDGYSGNCWVNSLDQYLFLTDLAPQNWWKVIPWSEVYFNIILFLAILQSGSKVLDYSSIFIVDFPHSPYVDPHCTGTDVTVECNIETRDGKVEFYFKTRVWDYNSTSQWTKYSFQSCQRMNGAKWREAVWWLLVLIVAMIF